MARLGKSRQVQASPGKWAGDKEILTYRHLGYCWLIKASLAKSRQVGWRQGNPDIYASRLLVARLAKSRQV